MGDVPMRYKFNVRVHGTQLLFGLAIVITPGPHVKRQEYPRPSTEGDSVRTGFGGEGGGGVQSQWTHNGTRTSDATQACQSMSYCR